MCRKTCATASTATTERNNALQLPISHRHVSGLFFSKSWHARAFKRPQAAPSPIVTPDERVGDLQIQNLPGRPEGRESNAGPNKGNRASNILLCRFCLSCSPVTHPRSGYSSPHPVDQCADKHGKNGKGKENQDHPDHNLRPSTPPKLKLPAVQTL